MRATSARSRRTSASARERLALSLPAGLRWRLTAWVAAVLLVSAAVVFLVVYQDTGTQLENEIDRDISGDTGQLVQSLSALHGQSPARIEAAAFDYVRTQSFTATSTILFVLMPVGTASDHPELFGSSRPE